MKKRLLALPLAMLMCLGTAAGSFPVYADAMPDAVWDAGQRGSVLVDYSDDMDGKQPVAGAEFTLYKIADFTDEADENGEVRSTYRSLFDDIDITDIVEAKAAGQAKLESSGQKDVYAPVEGYTGERKEKDGKLSVDTDTDPAGYLEKVRALYKKAEEEGRISEVPAESLFKKAGADKKEAEEKPEDLTASSDGTDKEDASVSGTEEKASSGLINTSDTAGAEDQKDAQAEESTDGEKTGEIDVSGWTGEGELFRFTKATDKDGKAEFKNLPLGLYVLAETKPAEHHWESAPCLITIPFMDSDEKGVQYWNYAQVVEPKARPLGDLSVEKKLSGNNTEKNREWHFVLNLSETSGYVRGEKLSYPYKKSDGSTGTVGNGGTITLKGGESVKITDIPAGTEFKLIETEANRDSYTTTSTGAKGHIEAFKTASASFTNARSKGENVQTGDTDYRLYAGGLITALVMLAIVLVSKRRKDSKETEREG